MLLRIVWQCALVSWDCMFTAILFEATCNNYYNITTKVRPIIIVTSTACLNGHRAVLEHLILVLLTLKSKWLGKYGLKIFKMFDFKQHIIRSLLQATELEQSL